jgi:hypothetical protein
MRAPSTLPKIEGVAPTKAKPERYQLGVSMCVAASAFVAAPPTRGSTAIVMLGRWKWPP